MYSIRVLHFPVVPLVRRFLASAIAATLALVLSRSNLVAQIVAKSERCTAFQDSGVREQPEPLSELPRLLSANP